MLALKRLLKFARLPRHDRVLILTAATALLTCRVRLFLRDAASLQRWATRRGSGNAPAERLSWAFGKACRLLPRATCLERALTLQHLLAAHGHGSELRIGAAKQSGKFAAHAWLTRDGAVLTGGDELAAGYKVLTGWSLLEDGRTHDLDLTRS
jgi:hypothetical protein